MQRGPALRPDQFLNQAGITDNLDIAETHTNFAAGIGRRYVNIDPRWIFSSGGILFLAGILTGVDSEEIDYGMSKSEWIQQTSPYHYIDDLPYYGMIIHE
jgi:hypothetical protein